MISFKCPFRIYSAFDLPNHDSLALVKVCRRRSTHRLDRSQGQAGQLQLPAANAHKGVPQFHLPLKQTQIPRSLLSSPVPPVIHWAWTLKNARGSGSGWWVGSTKAALPNLSGTRDQFRGRQFFHRPGRGAGGGGWGGMVEAVMWAMGSGRWSFNRLPLTSCCAAWFLTGQGPTLVRGPGAGDPCTKSFLTIVPKSQFQNINNFKDKDKQTNCEE